MRATIQAVAKAAGVSKSTVSFVINDSHPQVDRIPLETRERVKACAEALGYHGSPIAAALRTRRPLWIGVVTDILPNDPAKWTWAPFFEMSLLSGAQRKLAAHGYFTLLGLRHTEDEAQVKDLDLLSSAEIGGLILKAAQGGAVKKAKALLTANIPVVNVFPIERSDLYPHIVDLDNVAAGRMAADLVVKSSSRNPAFITKQGHIVKDRTDGFVSAIQQELGVVPAVCEMVPGVDDLKAAAIIADFIRKNRPDFVVALDAGLSMQLIMAADILDLNIPDDLSLVGFDCLVYKTAKHQRISSVGVSWLDAGEMAAQIIIDAIEGVEDRKLPGLLKPIFVPGDTTPSGLPYEFAREYVRALASMSV